MPPKKPSANHFLFKTISHPVGFLFIAIGFDQLAKQIVVRWFPQLVRLNPGAALSFDIPLMLSVVVSVGLLLYLTLQPKRGWWLMLLVAGGLSNALDRIVWGAVVDFIHYPFDFVGNVADVYIFFGLVGLVQHVLKKR